MLIGDPADDSGRASTKGRICSAEVWFRTENVPNACNRNEANFMGRLLNIVTPLHKATKRDYLARMMDDKVHCMMKAKEYEFDYWDGDRRYGYGGYKFIEGRWKPVAQALIDIYGLNNGSRSSTSAAARRSCSTR